MLGLGVLGFLMVLLWAPWETEGERISATVVADFQKHDETRRVVRRTGVRSNPEFLPPVQEIEADSGVEETGSNPEEPGVILGTIFNAAGLSEGSVWVGASCADGYIWADNDGDFFTYAQPGLCSLKAYRQFGVLHIWSDPVEVEVQSGQEVVVRLEVPDWQPAGLGISLSEVDLGIEVGFVYPGSPAERAGIETGDIITEIDGTAAVDLSVNEFVEHGIGQAGTEVDLVVDSGDSERLVTVTRGLVEDSHRPRSTGTHVHGKR